MSFRPAPAPAARIGSSTHRPGSSASICEGIHIFAFDGSGSEQGVESPSFPAWGLLAKRMVGVWWLLTREDFAADGSRRIDSSLGANPLGNLTTTPDRFAAQVTKRDRSEATQPIAAPSGVNNTGAVGGYDAYFGAF